MNAVRVNFRGQNLNSHFCAPRLSVPDDTGKSNRIFLKRGIGAKALEIDVVIAS